ncbi:hypothetical protein [Rhodoblastus sp.]|uniref:hypothetical protein n=1 Tax=Rhodoblastus sp. TaxID=1962975 RepID=UPI0035B169E7
MSEQEIIVPPQPRRQDARDLQARLYREIGLAAVEAELFAPRPELTAAPEVKADVRFETRADRSPRIAAPKRDAA